MDTPEECIAAALGMVLALLAYAALAMTLAMGVGWIILTVIDFVFGR